MSDMDDELDDLEADMESELEDYPGEADEGQDNPVVTREQEHANEPRMGTKGPPMVKRQLAAVWDENGAIKVALVVGGRQMERFRSPTAAEFQELKQRGYFVRGGLAGADAAGAPTVTINWGRVLAVGAIALVGGVLVYSKAKELGYIGGDGESDMDADEDVDDADDEGEDA